MVRTLTGRNGFTLVELMVAVFIFALVLLLLFRAFDGITSAMVTGRRQAGMSRVLHAADRLLREDLEQALVSTRWPLTWSDAPSDSVPALAFLRLREGAGETNDTEWVQYWWEPASNVYHWVRYAGPATNLDVTVVRDDLVGEIILDAGIGCFLSLLDKEGSALSPGNLERPPAVVDVRLATAPEPLPPIQQVSSNFLQRVRQLDGDWVDIRVRPKMGRGPIGEGVP